MLSPDEDDPAVAMIPIPHIDGWWEVQINIGIWMIGLAMALAILRPIVLFVCTIDLRLGIWRAERAVRKARGG